MIGACQAQLQEGRVYGAKLAIHPFDDTLWLVQQQIVWTLIGRALATRVARSYDGQQFRVTPDKDDRTQLYGIIGQCPHRSEVEEVLPWYICGGCRDGAAHMHANESQKASAPRHCFESVSAPLPTTAAAVASTSSSNKEIGRTGSRALAFYKQPGPSSQVCKVSERTRVAYLHAWCHAWCLRNWIRPGEDIESTGPSSYVEDVGSLCVVMLLRSHSRLSANHNWNWSDISLLSDCVRFGTGCSAIH